MNDTVQKPSIENPDLQERKLLARLIAGDRGGYECLFHKYYPTFFAFIKGMTKDSFAAEDIAQNIFLKVWVNRENLDETKSIHNYLFVLAKNEVFNYLRTKKRIFTPIQDSVFDRATEGGGFLRPDNEIEEKIAYDETNARVERIIDNMPRQRQFVFRLSRFEHQPNKEIAKQLNISVRTVDKHLELALKEIRQHLCMLATLLGLFSGMD